MSRDIEEKVINLVDAGKTVSQIAHEVDRSYTTVRRLVRKLEWAGRLPPPSRYAYWRRVTRLGRIGDVLNVLSKKEQEKLLQRVPADKTLAEYLGVLIKEGLNE